MDIIQGYGTNENYPPYYLDAVRSANQLGWDPDVVYAQWVHETGWFKSDNFKNNNNIAGQTWRSYMPYSQKGTARPSAEGGYYIKYDDPVQGYVDFVKGNNRYNMVRNYQTELDQIKEIKRGGWAVDPDYVNKVYGVLKTVREKYGGLDTPIGGKTYLSGAPWEEEQGQLTYDPKSAGVYTIFDNLNRQMNVDKSETGLNYFVSNTQSIMYRGVFILLGLILLMIGLYQFLGRTL